MIILDNDFKTEMSGLFSQLSSMKKKSFLEFESSDLPNSIPGGATCKAEPLKASDAEFYDLVAIQLNGKLCLRRVLRKSEDGVIVCGDEFSDIEARFYRGALLKIVEAKHSGLDLNIPRSAGLGLRLSWLLSLFTGVVSMVTQRA